MKKVLTYVLYVLLIALFFYLVWKFSFLLVWIAIAAVLSFVGEPLMRFFGKIHIRNWHIPKALSALLSILVIVLVMSAFVGIFVPLITSQASTISKINITEMTQNLQGPLKWLDEKAHDFGAIPYDQSFQDFLLQRIKVLLSFGNITAVFNQIIGVAGSMLMGFFSVLFIAFFFLKDENFFEENLLSVIPIKHHKATRNVIGDSKLMLKRYFIGLLLELIGVMTLITIGLLILGVKNALLIGFFGGLMNIIPYLGPLIGGVIGVSLAITSAMAAGMYDSLLPLLVEVIVVFAVANQIDGILLQPLIYSNSVKAHPLEIFFVIVMGGSLAGIVGMLVAIPVYTVLRIIAREFFAEFRLVKKLTESMNPE